MELDTKVSFNDIFSSQHNILCTLPANSIERSSHYFHQALHQQLTLIWIKEGEATQSQSEQNIVSTF